jgi:hypothetical protein
LLSKNQLKIIKAVLNKFLFLLTAGIFYTYELFAVNANNFALTLPHLISELKRVPPFEVLEGQFKQQKKILEFDLALSSEGTFQILQNLKSDQFALYWKIEKPEATEICIDTLNIVMKQMNSKGQKQTKTIKIEDLGASSQSIIFLMQILKMDPKNIHQNFAVSKIGQSEFIFTPREIAKSFFLQARIKFNKTGLVEKTEILEKNKDEMNIEFINLKTKKISKTSREPSC